MIMAPLSKAPAAIPILVAMGALAGEPMVLANLGHGTRGLCHGIGELKHESPR